MRQGSLLVHENRSRDGRDAQATMFVKSRCRCTTNMYMKARYIVLYYLLIVSRKNEIEIIGNNLVAFHLFRSELQSLISG